MMALSIIGIVVMAAIVGYGAYMVSQNVTLKNTKPRYKYVDTVDEDGNIITKIIDLEDKE
jgi:hypothetical protein